MIFDFIFINDSPETWFSRYVSYNELILDLIAFVHYNFYKIIKIAIGKK